MPSLWETLLTLLNAAAIFYIRRGSKKDTARVIRSTAAQSTSDSIESIVKKMQVDIELLKKVIVDPSSIDDRSPKRSQEND